MGLIKCPECGKEVSDMAQSCPNCGRPLRTNVQDNIGKDSAKQPVYQENGVPQKKKKGHGCLITFLVIIAIFVIFSIILSNAIKEVEENPEKYNDSIAAKYIEVTEEQGISIDSILKECGIETLDSMEHDELLDNAHFDGETGYRASIGKVDNIIIYLSSDMSVYNIRYADYDLYLDNNVVAVLQDYTFTSEEMSNLMINCQDQVKTVLKSPSTAKFPNITEWGFRKEKNLVTVQGYVDAQNSFGAEMRSEFQFIIDTDTDIIQSFIFDGQEMIQQ